LIPPLRFSQPFRSDSSEHYGIPLKEETANYYSPLCRLPMLRAKPAAWEDPEKSIGRKITVIKGKTIWEATGPASGIFGNKLFQIIDRLLEAHKEELESDEKVSRSVSFHLWMVGREPRSARPTVIFTCKSPGYRAKVIRTLKKSNVLADFPGIVLKSMDRRPAEPMGRNQNQLGSRFDGDSHSTEERIIYIREGNRDVCGTSIRVGTVHEATLGGVLLINGTYYGITSLHLRQDENNSLECLIGEDGELAFDEDSDIASTSKAKTTHWILDNPGRLSNTAA
jgi:hypothetical protein